MGEAIPLPKTIIPPREADRPFERPFSPNVRYYPGDGCEGTPAEIVRVWNGYRGSIARYADIRMENDRKLDKVHVGHIKSGAYVA